MKPWLALSRTIDMLNGHLGGLLKWLILVAVIISGGNAILRKVFNIGSNAWLEAQWYLFAAVFMLGAGYAFLRNAHVRIDFLANKLSPQGRNWIDIIGIVVFLAAAHAAADQPVVAAVRQCVDHRRDVAERRRPGALAGHAADPGRHGAAAGAGDLGTDQAHCLSARTDPGPTRA